MTARFRITALIAAGAGLLALAACQTETRAKKPHLSGAQPTLPSREVMNNAPAGSTQPIPAKSQISVSRAEIVGLGIIPTDDSCLPLVSPDGRFVAVQTGVAPTWSTMLAAANSQVPTATGIDIIELDLRLGVPPVERRPASHVTTLTEPALLGRSSDEEGFLIEAPREDGSRWIGKALWTDGSIRWLVQDEHVNAFATMGGGERLAWSRRLAGTDRFELVINREGVEWTAGNETDDWLLPTWTGHNDALFCLHLRGAQLAALSMIASSETAMKQSVRRLPLAEDADIDVAFQTLNGQVVTIGLPAPAHDQLLLLHPARMRMALWRPRVRIGEPLILLAPRSFFAIAPNDDVALISTRKNLMLQATEPNSPVTELLSGLIATRQINNPNMPFINLGMGVKDTGQIGLTGMRLVPVGQQAAAPSR